MVGLSGAGCFLKFSDQNKPSGSHRTVPYCKEVRVERDDDDDDNDRLPVNDTSGVGQDVVTDSKNRNLLDTITNTWLPTERKGETRHVIIIVPVSLSLSCLSNHMGISSHHTKVMSLLEEFYEPPLPPAPTEPQSPIQTYQLRKELGGIATEIAIQTFDDRILVLVSQSGKIGCLVSIRIAWCAEQHGFQFSYSTLHANLRFKPLYLQ